MQRIVLTFLVLFGIAAATASADEATINPTQDVFIYQGLPTSNFQSGPFASFNTVISAGKTNTGHDIQALTQFDMSGINVDSGETATLNLYVVNSPFGGTPSASFPVTTEVYTLDAPWDDDTATWGASPPSHGATPIGSAVIDGANQWISIDITSWASSPTPNGLILIQPTVVTNGSGQAVAATFSSVDSATNKPFLQVPEPSSLALLGGVGLFVLGRRRHGHATRSSRFYIG